MKWCGKYASGGGHWQANCPSLASSPVTTTSESSGNTAATTSANGITRDDQNILDQAGDNVETVGTGAFARLRAAGLL